MHSYACKGHLWFIFQEQYSSDVPPVTTPARQTVSSEKKKVKQQASKERIGKKTQSLNRKSFTSDAPLVPPAHQTVSSENKKMIDKISKEHSYQSISQKAPSLKRKSSSTLEERITKDKKRDEAQKEPSHSSVKVCILEKSQMSRS